MSETIALLKPDKKNRRKHNERNIGMIVNSLQQVGASRSIVIDEDYNILAGNGTVEAAQLAGIERMRIVDADGEEIIAVRRTGLSDDQKRKLALYDNRTAELADWNLDQMLEDINAGLDFDGMFGKAELDELLKDIRPAGDEDAEPQIDKAEELRIKWGVESGQLWQIGEHKLICGDSTDKAVVERLMGGEKAAMCFTSPPYNQGGKAAKRLPAFYKGEGDNKTKEEYFYFLISVLECLKDNLSPDAPLLWNVSYNSQSRDDYGRIIFSASNPFHVMETIVWDKKNGFNISARGILSRDSELIFLMCYGEDYYTNQGRYDIWYNTWRIGTNGSQTEGHGAAYPLELVERGISLFSPENSFILDPFLGSGTTMVACENLKRKCRGVEISAGYIAVVLQRMQDAFGITGVLVDSTEQ